MEAFGPAKKRKVFCMNSILGFMLLCLPAMGQSHEDGKNPFKDALRTSNPSIARADLLACAQLGQAKHNKLGDLDIEEFARTLTGTWIRELSWYGVGVQTESALYFDFIVADGKATGDAMMFDQSNLGEGPLGAMLENLKRDPEAMEKIPTLVYVDCDYSMVDRYYKISNDLLFHGLGGMAHTSYTASAGVLDGGETALSSTWKHLNSNGFFDRRFPIIQGQAEMLLPSVGGSYWPVASVTQSRGDQDAEGALLQMSGDYQFVHAGDEEVFKFSGNEIGQFHMEGGAFIASKRATGSTATGSNQASSTVEGYDTDCDEIFFQVPVNYERVVLEPTVGASLQEKAAN